MKNILTNGSIGHAARILFIACTMLLASSPGRSFAQAEAASLLVASPIQNWVLVVHGGAGGPAKGALSAEQEKAYTDNLNEALAIGSAILAKGGTSLDAVEAAVRYMEDCPLFNAGKGAVLNEEGVAELDASIMDGKTGRAGAVAAVTTIKNPISAARRVMDSTNHVMLVGTGADKFALAQKLEIVDPAYFITPERLKTWKKSLGGMEKPQPVKPSENPPEKGKPGTVGAVALDIWGNLAAATSTGGMMNKRAGRVGDSPIIGAGTYASNNTCAVSCTGHGEYFIRNVVAYDVSALMEYRSMPLEEAGKQVIMEKLVKQKAEGGLIAVDQQGHVIMPFNTNAMFRGFIKGSGEKEVAIY